MPNSFLSEYWPFVVMGAFFILLFIGTIVWDEVFPEKKENPDQSVDEEEFAITRLEAKARQMLVIVENSRERKTREQNEPASVAR